MEKVVLHATLRSVTGKQVGVLRREGKLPAIMYGYQVEPTPIVLDLREATRLLHGLTGSSVVTVEVDGKENSVLVREKQRDFIRGTLLHVDFLVISMTTKIRTDVAVEIVGLSPAVKDFNGVVTTGVSKVEVEALPQYLPERFIVDISHLAKIGDSIHVRDLPVLENVEVLEDGDEMIVNITAEAAEEAAEEVVASAEEPEVIEKGKKEEEIEEKK